MEGGEAAEEGMEAEGVTQRRALQDRVGPSPAGVAFRPGRSTL